MAQKCIIVVEDNTEIFNVISLVLMADPYDIIHCPSAKAFREALDKYTPDIILMDIMLPDGNGVELCNEVKTGEGTKSIPVYLMSAHIDYPSPDMIDADGFIKKPFDIFQLRELVKDNII